MKKTFLFFITLVLLSCNSNQYVSIDKNRVIITDFQWGGDPQVWGSMTGDFQTLDVEIFNSLKGKSGVFSLVLNNNVADQYGNKTTKSYSVGTINADELNKYQSVSYWRSGTGGTLDIFARYIKMK